MVGQLSPSEIADLLKNATSQIELAQKEQGNGKSDSPPINVNTDGVFKLVGGMLIFVVIWAVLGVGAFVMSLVCFSKKGTANGSSNVIGLLLAIFLGPFYWLYYFGSGTYCKTLPVPKALA